MKNTAFLTFQISCCNCYEIIYQDEYFVVIDISGEPLNSEKERVFSQPEFNKIEACHYCDSTELSKDYNFSPDQDPSDDDDDLPF